MAQRLKRQIEVDATGTIKMTPEIDNWFKDMEALAIVQTWRKLKKDAKQ